MSRHSVLLGIAILLQLVLLGYVQASSESFTVAGGEHVARFLTLSEGDEVRGRITVVGGVQENTLNVSIFGPDDGPVLSYQNVGLVDFHFSASKEGAHRFYFDNGCSQETKHVTLSYNVQHYLFGFPQEYVIVFIIVGLAFLAVVVFVAMSPKP